MSTENINTKPTIETVLQRINTLGENLSQQINSLRDEFNTRISSVEARLQSHSEEMRVVLRDFSFKIDALNKNFLQLQANQMDLRERVENLESKAS